ncbi:monoamine oxidase [Hymenobacter sp. UYP22]
MRAATAAERQAAVLGQLMRLFGPRAADPVAYHGVDWAREPYTSTAGDKYPS